MSDNTSEHLVDKVRERYGRIAEGKESGCCGPQSGCDVESAVSLGIGYSADELARIPEEANLGLGCGAPLDHHTVWFLDGVRVTWREAFEDMDSQWDRDTRGHPTPRRRAGATRGKARQGGPPWRSSRPPSTSAPTSMPSSR